jgi:hypothetical protein
MTENELYDELWAEQHLPDKYKEMMRGPLTSTLVFKWRILQDAFSPLSREQKKKALAWMNKLFGLTGR